MPGQIINSPAAILRLREFGGPIVGVAIGNSETQGSSDRTAAIQGSNTYWNQLQWLSRARIIFRKQIGIPGNTAAQIVTRLQDEALSVPGINAIFFLGGTNDLPTADQTVPLRSFRAAIRAAHSRGLAAFMLAVPPSNNYGAAGLTLNSAYAAIAQAEGAIFIDLWSSMRAGNGTWASGTTYTPDGIHPNQLASNIGAAAILSRLSPFLPTYGAGSLVITGDQASVIPNAQFLLTTTNGFGTQAQQATFYGTTAGYTLSVIADSANNIAGNLQRFAFSASATASAFFDIASVDVTPYGGKRIRFSGRLRLSGVQAAGATVQIRLLGTDAFEGNSLNLVPQDALAIDGDGYFYGETSVPPGSTTATIRVQINTAAGGAGTVDVGEFAIGLAGNSLAENAGLALTRQQRIQGRVKQVTANYTATVDDHYILVDATAGAVTVTLPALVRSSNAYNNNAFSGYGINLPGGGLDYVVVKVDASANAVSVAPPSAHTINGSSSAQTISAQNGSLIIFATSNSRYFAK